MATKDPESIYNIIDSNEPWRGRMLFTGPDANRDHRVTVDQEHRHIGIGTMSAEGTGEADYIWRAGAQTPHPRPRSRMVGEVGWGVPYMTDWKMPRSGRQVVLGEFRQECEDRYSHLYQNPWYPGPRDDVTPGSDASLVMNVYRPRTTPGNTRAGSSRSRPPNSPHRRTTEGTTVNDGRTSYNILKVSHTGNVDEQPSSSEQDTSVTGE
ncbi:protein SPMIP2-like isoform X1 [Argopecten irradians]|uniref:protein SPMIP2-like isoform X1 n=1 Tax=Argopecten irradians TaxID=31199 RepID=UPI0037223D1A